MTTVLLKGETLSYNEKFILKETRFFNITMFYWNKQIRVEHLTHNNDVELSSDFNVEIANKIQTQTDEKLHFQ